MKCSLAAALLLAVVVSPARNFPQNQSSPTAAPGSAFPSDYPSTPGFFIQQASWKEISNETPTKTKTKNGIAASLSYGAVPAKIVSEYEGEHASIQVPAGKVVICICHIVGLPGTPVIARLHPKKNLRELDGGKMIVYPVVGGSKSADANKSDLVAVDVTHSDPNVWLVRSQSDLEPGEYALMLGTTNLNIYPFSVVAPPAPAAPTK